MLLLLLVSFRLAVLPSVWAQCPGGFSRSQGLCVYIRQRVRYSHCNIHRICYQRQKSRLATIAEVDTINSLYMLTTSVADSLVFPNSQGSKDFYDGSDTLIDNYSRLGLSPSASFSFGCFHLLRDRNYKAHCNKGVANSFACVAEEGRYALSDSSVFLADTWPEHADRVIATTKRTCDYGYIHSSTVFNCLINWMKDFGKYKWKTCSLSFSSSMQEVNLHCRCHKNAACVSVYYSKVLKRCHQILYSDTPLPPHYQVQASLYRRYQRRRT